MQRFDFFKIICIFCVLVILVGCRSSFSFHVVVRHDWISKLKINEMRKFEVVDEPKNIRDQSQNIIVTQREDLKLIGPKSKLYHSDIGRTLSVRDDQGIVYNDNIYNSNASIYVGQETNTQTGQVFLTFRRVK